MIALIIAVGLTIAVAATLIVLAAVGVGVAAEFDDQGRDRLP